MKRPALFVPFAIAAACIATPANSQDSTTEADQRRGLQQQERQAVTVYRQVMPDGRVVYSDKALKGSKLNEKITIEAPIEGNLWTTEASNGPSVVPQVDPTPVIPVNSIPPVGHQKTVEEATSDVIHAEMLLEDAKDRLRANALSSSSGGAGDRTTRQKLLARDVAEAEVALRRAVTLRNTLRQNR